MEKFGILFESGLVIDPNDSNFEKLLEQLQEIPYPVPIVTGFN